MKRQSHAEFMAIPIALVILGVLFLVFFAAAEGVWAWILLGLALLAILAAATLAVARRQRHPSELGPPTRPPPRRDGRFRVLVVCDGSCTSPAFQEVLRHAGGRPVEALVVAPAVGSRLSHWTGDDRGRAEAKQHLENTVRALAEVEVEARGTIGSDDPIEAADDTLREFPADELVFATHPEAQANRLERDVVEVARARYNLPVTHVVVDVS
jgi:GABA permease